mmetsp:Transcript_13839/g.19827  ORF Transcript_13839/g.19827 Transcript_13839/m.19827 type:complete len:140 (-) Transcript_13839:210-629(-)
MSKAYLSEMLDKVSSTRQSVKESATEMQLYYVLNPNNAVRLWREGIESCRTTQMLALIYVVNEVMQMTKRSLWPKILQDFSLVLPKTLCFACKKVPSIVKEVQRIVLIWKTIRKIFSVLFSEYLLDGLPKATYPYQRLP